MKIIFLVLTAAALCGCVSESTMLKNQATGQTTKCEAWGLGIIGVPVALASHADCMKKAHAAGFSEFPGATPALQKP